jgi:4-carboxymuconolactone decarboxylase
LIPLELDAEWEGRWSMGELNSSQRDLVAIGAALGSNCVPCVEHYVSEARKAGLNDRQIEDAIHVADGVRRVPAQRVRDAALAVLSKSVGPGTGAPPEAERNGGDQGSRAPGGSPDRTATAAQTACADRKGSCC